MKIGFCIGALHAGGSERQLIYLARALAEKGHKVEILSYDGPGAFDTFFAQSLVHHRIVRARSKREKIRIVREWLTDFQPHIVQGVMKRASSLIILASGWKHPWKIIGSDLSTAAYAPYKPSLWASVLLFHRAQAIVTQTKMNKRALSRLSPFLAKKIHIIRNGVDIHRFRPPAKYQDDDVFRFLVVGSIFHVKNPVRLVQAVARLKEMTDRPFHVEWVGRPSRHSSEEASRDYRICMNLVERYNLHPYISFHGEVSNIESVYRKKHALIHVSLQEGIPNAVVEAMASGLPIVVSAISDLPDIVREANNGFVCHHKDVQSIAHAMKKMLELPYNSWHEMAQRSRTYAVKHFSHERFVSDYLNLYASLMPS